MIPILADENIPRAAVAFLRRQGLDVAAVSERSQGASDTDVLAIARAEERLLVTFDRDFGELVFSHRQSPPIGIVFFRFVPVDPEEPARVLLDLLRHSSIALDDRFTVATRDTVRQRNMP